MSYKIPQLSPDICFEADQEVILGQPLIIF